MTLAVMGAAAAKAETLFLALCSAKVSITSPVQTMTHKIQAAGNCAVAKVEIKAMMASMSVPTFPDLRLVMMLPRMMKAMYMDKAAMTTMEAVTKPPCPDALPMPHRIRLTSPAPRVMTIFLYDSKRCFIRAIMPPVPRLSEGRQRVRSSRPPRPAVWVPLSYMPSSTPEDGDTRRRWKKARHAS